MNFRAPRKPLSKRARAYRYKPGTFTLTASFRDASIDMTVVRLVASLIPHATQKQLAIAFACNTSTVGKLVRIAAANGLLKAQEVQS